MQIDKQRKMTPEQKARLIEILASGEELSAEWSRILFPPERKEYELVYHGKEREEDVLADTMAVPLQPTRSFNNNGSGWHNKLIFGDNLQAMRTLLELKERGELCNADGSQGVRLVYIDPPFATKKEFTGSEDQKAYQDKIVGAEFIEFLRRRLILIRELLSDNGSVYVHLDWKKSHYIRAILDEVFGEKRFINEIIWYYSNKYGSNSDGFASFHNTLFRYGKGKSFIYNNIKIPVKQARAQPLRAWNKELNKNEWLRGADGKYLYQDSTIKDAGDVWEIPVINPMAKERVGYPTQKPEKLLEWIINSSCNPGDLVLDAFGGSGTTLAVAEKLGRRWIGIDCGKLSIYTIQKRMLNLKQEIGNRGRALRAKPFSLYNAGLYDFARLRELPWEEWRRFALTLFGCQALEQRIGGIKFDGLLKSCPVLVFDHRKEKGAIVSEETLRSIHQAAGSKIGTRAFIIAPAMAFDFQQDYIEIGDVRYYALRVPYSIIHELHHKDFLALKQPSDELAVNETVDAVGFDFIKTPELEYLVGRNKRDGELLVEAYIRILAFHSEATVREPIRKHHNRATLSMVMLDYDYDVERDVFELDDVFYADAIENANWEVRFPANRISTNLMAVFLDIYGNEARVVIPSSNFSERPKREIRKPKPTKKKKTRRTAKA